MLELVEDDDVLIDDDEVLVVTTLTLAQPTSAMSAMTKMKAMKVILFMIYPKDSYFLISTEIISEVILEFGIIFRFLSVVTRVVWKI